MPEPGLRGRRVLVVEDEYMLADDLCGELSEQGAIAIGPAARLADAAEMIEACGPLDGAILDLNLGGEMAFSIADMLTARTVPFVFTTGYDRSAIPDRFADVPLCEKPFDADEVARALSRLVGETPGDMPG